MKHKYKGFWLWKQEMDRLEVWPQMSEVYRATSIADTRKQAEELLGLV